MLLASPTSSRPPHGIDSVCRWNNPGRPDVEQIGAIWPSRCDGPSVAAVPFARRHNESRLGRFLPVRSGSLPDHTVELLTPADVWGWRQPLGCPRRHPTIMDTGVETAVAERPEVQPPVSCSQALILRCLG